MSEPASRLPARPSLEQLRKQAKDLLHLVRAGDAVAAQRVHSAIPRLAGSTKPPPTLSLADAQFVLAREHGFRNWSDLARHVAAVNPPTDGTAGRSQIRPIELTKSEPLELPDGGYASADDVWAIFTATCDGDIDRVRQLVARYPSLARYEYNYTPPIHFAVREGHPALVRFFLDRGADATYRSYPFGDSLVTMADDRENREIGELLRTHLARRFALADGTGAIIGAARKGDIDRVNAELARNPDLARRSNETGDTALHGAVEGGHLSVVRRLIDAGANVDAVRGDGFRPVHCALMKTRGDRTALSDALIAAGAEYTIFVAAARGDRGFVRDAVARDPSLANCEDTCHHRPISAAANRGDLEMVKLLLAHGADPNLPEEGAPRGHALWSAVYHRQREMARVLVQHGADPNAMVESSGTPMEHARKDPELFQLLMAHGGDHKPGPFDGLHRALDAGDLATAEAIIREHQDLVQRTDAYWGDGILAGPANARRRDVITLLLRYGARVPKVSKWAPFYYFKHYDIAELLLEHGMDPNHMSWHRLTLLHHMAASGELAKARLLLDHGADIGAIDLEYQSTPLGVAVRFGQRELVTLMIERGADPNASGAPWSTPLAWARKRGHADLEATLIAHGAI
jgi:ankyrin repeat protein